MEYRPFTLEDLPRTAKLYVDYYNAYEDGEGTIETTTKRIHQVMTREDAFGLLLEDKGRLLGFAMACVFATLYAVATKGAPGRANEVAGLMILAISAGAIPGPAIGAIVSATGNPRCGVLFVIACVGYLLWAGIRLRRVRRDDPK